MTWVFAVLIVAVIGGVAMVAAGKGAPMAEEYDDRPDVRVQADGPLTAADLRGLRFTTALRGYRASEVDTLIARLADQLEQAPTGPAQTAAEQPPRPPPDPESRA